MKAISELDVAAAVAASAFAADRDQLCVLTCGSVDDGKSTLIGRLLLDASLVFDDHVAALTRDSKTHGTVGDELDPALLVDGLEAEREQGITIDVAYRYFGTARRRFIVADTPGHKDYTRNMVTGASTSDLAILLVDAEKGLLEQTRRHAFLCSLLGIRQFVLAVNKMDLVGFDERRFQDIGESFTQFAGRFPACNVVAIPLSALHGDNVVRASARTPWYQGLPLLQYLETVAVDERPGSRAAAPAGAIRQSAECELSRLCRNGGVRSAVQRHGHYYTAHRSAHARGADRDHGRRPRSRSARPMP